MDEGSIPTASSYLQVEKWRHLGRCPKVPLSKWSSNLSTFSVLGTLLVLPQNFSVSRFGMGLRICFFFSFKQHFNKWPGAVGAADAETHSGNCCSGRKISHSTGNKITMTIADIYEVLAMCPVPFYSFSWNTSFNLPSSLGIESLALSPVCRWI